MVSGILSLVLLANSVQAEEAAANETIVVTGRKKIPDASYQLKLDAYDLQLSDYRFPSGLRILFQSEHSQPIVAITSVIDTGSEYDQEGVEGIAHVLEHLAFRANHGGIKNWDLISQMGGTINASTSVDWTNYMTIAPRDALTPLLRIEALRMQDGIKGVTQQDVVTESEIARNELRMRYENAAVSAAMEIIGSQLFPADHPYSRSTIGSHETLSNIDLERAQEYMEDNYRPENVTIIVVGDFDLKDAGTLIFDAFEGSEELLMAPENATEFTALSEVNDQIKYLNDWFAQDLQPYLEEASKEEYPARVDCSKRGVPPAPTVPYTKDIPVIQGMTEKTTAILAWSLPGGYCDDQPTMQMSASLLTNYIYQTIVPSWEYGKEDSSVDGIGCFLNPEEYYSTLLCFIEQGQGGYSAEKLVDKAADSLYLQTQKYDPNMVNTFVEWNFNYARSQGMAGLLQSVDAVSSLSGRATATAMYTHFTGDPRYFTANMNAMNQVTPAATQDVAAKYITRDRMVAVIVEPMDEEERERREASASKDSRTEEVQQYHAAKEEDRYKSLYSADEVNKEMIDSQLVTPDLTDLHRFTLSNGLEVAILPYGEAPLVRIGLAVKGDMSAGSPKGINSMAEYALGIGDKSSENLLAVAGFMSGSDTSLTVAGSSGNLSALLNKMRWMIEPTNFEWTNTPYRKKKAKSWAKGVKSSSKYQDEWASRYMYETLYPEHSYGHWMHPDDYLAMKEWDDGMLKGWIFNKWQPANAELIIVGRIDSTEAEALVRQYFASWEYVGEGEAKEFAKMSLPTKQPTRSVFVFDKPIATQTQVNMSCQIDTKDQYDDRARSQVVGQVLSQMAWRKLREEAGVTYGAGAYASVRQSGSGSLYLTSLVQNDSTGFAVKTMFDIVADGAKGNVSGQGIADAKLSLAREYVLGQQSGEQMLRRLMGTGMENFDFFDKYGAALADVSKDDFKTLLKKCEGKEVVTLVGPISEIEPQLKEKNIEYKVINWEEERRSLLTEKERKKEDKAKAKAEKKKAKEK